MAENDKSSASTATWQALAEKDLRGKPVARARLADARGHRRQAALYRRRSRSDRGGRAGLARGMPGFAPYLRGPRATMYANRPWTIRQYAGFSTAEESNRFYRAQSRGRADGAVGRLRSGDPSRL